MQNKLFFFIYISCVPDHLLCSASWTCGASCCRRWGADTWRQMTCAAIRGYSWITETKRNVHFTQNTLNTSWTVQLKHKVRFAINEQWIKGLTRNSSWRLLCVRSCMRCCLRKEIKTTTSFVLLTANKRVILKKRRHFVRWKQSQNAKEWHFLK